MNRQPLLIAVVVVLLAAVGGYMGLVKPPTEDAAAVQEQIDGQQDALAAAQAQLQAAEASKAQYRAAYTEILRLGKAVPEDDDLQSLLVQLSATAAQSKVKFLSLERGGAGTATGAVPATGGAETTQTPLPPGATVGTSGFPVVSLKLTFAGRYFALSDFLARLHTYVRTRKQLRVKGRLLTIDGFTLNPEGEDDDASGGGKLTATVTATAYLVSPVEGATAGATAAGPAGSGATVSATPTPVPATGSAG